VLNPHGLNKFIFRVLCFLVELVSHPPHANFGLMNLVFGKIYMLSFSINVLMGRFEPSKKEFHKIAIFLRVFKN